MTTEILFHYGTYILLAIIFFAAVYYVTNKWVGIQQEKNKIALVKGKKPEANAPADALSMKKHFFPLQVEAYQRLVLFLERIAPNNMIMRLGNPGLPARAFQQKLLESVRQEYEHNLAQQIFVSEEAWKMVQSSKEETLKIINIAATQLNDTSLANDLSKSVFEITAQLQAQPTELAINFLKKELNKQV